MNFGYELIKSHMHMPFDLIILDILMPKISGMDTARLLREKGVKTPVVFISSSEEFGVMSYSVLAFDYILKPIDVERLRECMKRLFAQKKKKHYISVTYSGTETKILLSNIQCMESNLRKIIITLSENLEIEIVGKLADRILCDESEFCIMLSNLLENSIDAAKSYIEVSVKCLNNQLSLNVKNDYTGEIRKNADGCYMTTKQLGSGLGLKSVSAIVKKNGGLLKIDDRNGVFDVCAALRNF